MKDDKIEIITVFGGGESITYEAKDFLKNGDKATPIRQVMSPRSDKPYVELKLQDSEGVFVGETEQSIK